MILDRLANVKGSVSGRILVSRPLRILASASDTATGQRESVVDCRGLTSYQYDSRDRLLRVDNPEGTFVSYTYDLAGNRASVTSPSQTVGYTYYPDNRMEHVLEPGGGVFTYSYDRAGNQILGRSPKSRQTCSRKTCH